MPKIKLADELDAYDPWIIEIDGVEYEAAQVSQPERLKYDAAIQKAGADGMAQERALRSLLRVAFPPKLLRDWLTPRRDPVQRILGLDPTVRKRVLDSFFAALRSE